MGLVLNGLGVPLEAVDRMIHDLREQDYGETGLILGREKTRNR